MSQVQSFTEEQKGKIKEMSASEIKNIPLEERRVWFNALERRLKRPGLKPGLVEKIQSMKGQAKWEAVKSFMVDDDMRLDCIMFVVRNTPADFCRGTSQHRLW